jgi:predicted Zn-dependent protease
VAAVCISGAGSLSGKADASYNLLLKTLNDVDNISPDERLWAFTLLAEIAMRMGNAQVAEKHFKQALALEIRDSYLLGAYADFLLDQNRPFEAVSLLKDETRADGLLLRLSLAEKAIHTSTLSDHIAALKARFESSRIRSDMRHRREEARFTLRLLNQPREALNLAQDNFAVQREPWDARILLESALLARDPQAAQPVLDWLMKTKLEDVQLAKLARQLMRK